MGLDRHKRVKRESSQPLRYRSNGTIAKKLLKLKLTTAEPQISVTEKEAFDAFHMEMRIRHMPELPIHDNVVERATRRLWQLREIVIWRSNFLKAIQGAFLPRYFASPEDAKQFSDVLDILLRNKILEQVSKHEAAVDQLVKSSEQDLRELADWRLINGLKRGSIGYTVSTPDWARLVFHDMLPTETEPTKNEPSETELCPTSARVSQI